MQIALMVMLGMAMSLEAGAAGPQVGVPWAQARELTKPKPVQSDTDLIKDGQPVAAIASPEGAEWEALARKLQAGLAGDTGVLVPIVPVSTLVSGPVDAWTAEALKPFGQGGRNLILLGDLNSNAAVKRLYYQWQAFEDGAYPGPGGYVIRTVTDPEGLGWNAIILAGGTPPSAARAAETFAGKLQRQPNSVAAPYLQEVTWGDSPVAAELKKRAEGIINQPSDFWANYLLDPTSAEYKKFRPANGPFDWAQDVLNVALGYSAFHYALTGNPELAKIAGRAIDTLYRQMDWVEQNRTVSWDAHYNYEIWLRSWQQVANCPLLTDEQRAHGAAVFGFLAGQVCMYQWPLETYGKTTYRTLTRHEYSGIFAGDALCRYVQKHDEVQQPLADLLSANRNNLGVVIDTMLQDYCDGFDHKWGLDANWHFFQAAVEEPRPDFVTSGMARLSADYATMVIDNAGLFVNYGSENISPVENYDAWQVLGRAEAIFQDDSYRWWMNRYLTKTYKIFIAGMGYVIGHWYQPSPVTLSEAKGLDPSASPQDDAHKSVKRFVGLNRLPLSQHIYEDLKAGRGRAYEGIPVVNDVPFEQGFNKLTMREGLAPDDQYLMLDGLGGVTYSGADAGAISQYSRYGQRLLVQIDDKPDPFYQNFVSVSRGNAIDTTGTFARLTDMADLGPMMYVRLEVEPLCGATAVRRLFMEKGKYCLAFDDVTLKEADEYVVTSNWRALGDPAREGQGDWRFANEKADLRLQSIGLPGMSHLKHSITERASGIGQESTQFKIKLLRETSARAFKAGEQYRFANLFYGATPGEPLRHAGSALSASAIVTLSTDAIYGAAYDGEIHCGNIRLRAEACRLTADEAQLVRVRQISVGGKSLLNLTQPVTLDLNAAQERVTIQSPDSKPVGTIQWQPTWTVAGDWAALARGMALPSGAKIRLDAGGLMTAVRSLLKQPPPPPPPPPGSPLRSPAPGLKLAAKTLLQDAATINAVCLSDLDADGTNEVIAVTADGRLLATDLQGNKRLDVSLGNEALLSCWAGKLGDQNVILAGGLNGALVALDPSGKTLWRVRNARWWYGPGPAIYSIAVGDFGGDGDQMIACGTHGGGSLFDAQGKFVGFKQTYSHAMEPLKTVNLYGGKEQWTLGSTWGQGLKLWQPLKQQIVEPWFNSWGRVAHDIEMIPVGEDLWFAYAGPHGIACARLSREAWLAGKRDASVWQDNWYLRSDGETTALLPVDLNGDGVPEILTANETGFLVWYSLKGERLGKKLVGMPVSDMLLRDVSGDNQPEIVLTGRTPQVMALDGKLQIVGQWSDESDQAVTRAIALDGGPADSRPLLLQSEKQVRLLTR